MIFLQKSLTLFIEIKTKTGTLNTYQIAFKNKIENMGFKYYIITSTYDLRVILEKYEVIVNIGWERPW